MKNKERLLWIFIAVILSVSLIITNGTKLVKAQYLNDSATKALNLFQAVYVKVLTEYVDEQKPEDLIHNAIDGMIKGLGDPHSSLLKPKNLSALKTETTGQYGGLGIQVGMRDNKITVIAPMEDTPAERAGLRPDDKIIKINGTNAIGIELETAVEKLRGPVGEPVTITIEREGEKEPFDVTIVREIINIKSVKLATVATDIGYIRITSFSQNTPDQLATILKNISNSNYNGLIIDLRNNPGGLLESALKISDMFLDGGVIVSTRGRTSFSKQENYANPGTLIDDSLPLIVLVNKGSASASEIFAGALQDRKRALLLGTQTFGKASVQTLVNLDEGYGLRLTIARYYTPADRLIDKKGLTPDIIVELPQLSREEIEMITRLDKTNIVRKFALEYKDKEIKDEDFEKLKAEVKKAGIEVKDSILRSRLKFEQTRKYGEVDINLELDDQLREAVQILKSYPVLYRSKSSR